MGTRTRSSPDTLNGSLPAPLGTEMRGDEGGQGDPHFGSL